MAIDILNLQPTTISRDLKGKYVLIYGAPKVGKTSFAAKFKKNLLCAFEMGYNAIDGIYAQPISKWSDFKLLLRQLEQPAAKEKFDTITIDTASIAYDLCEQFVCAQNGVQKINEIPWGQGYTQVKSEFEACLRKITMLGYGLILIAHQEIRKETIDNNDIEFFSPALNKRCYEICNRLVDVIGYIAIEWDNEGNSERYLYTRQTPRVVAGSRYKYLAPKIKFGYQELVDAISDAIDKSEKLDGAVVVEETTPIHEDVLDYNQLRTEAQELWNKLVSGAGSEAASEEMAKRIMKRVEMIFGHPVKLSEITEDQVDLMQLVVVDMRDLANQ
jgi:hypothetical protein